MEKKYQVFISSTYTDLQEERSKVFQILMELDCIPAGMELFPAIDDEQFEFIKRIIDDCDYYLLIIGGRYGSLSQDGLSYTEKEYDYAILKGKKVLAFIHGKPEVIPMGKSETLPEVREKLQNFKQKVESGRLVKFWETPEELTAQIATNLPKTIRTYPAIGWVRGNAVSNEDLLQEVLKLRKEKEHLLDKLQSLDIDQIELSSEAKELLIKISEDPSGRIILQRTSGSIRVGNNSFVAPKNAQERAIWVEAVDLLEQNGFIEQLPSSNSSFLYIMTSGGFKEVKFLQG